ncbi:hypothetical protein PPERSA_08827 [Pseudocohnilembus persalinus]|uniref:Uncharacterized protein n=1 Tax=Pseudocohnilembus persalinus TaxID=266149 RepID=A0A0V0R3R5_PSEPJ|nr:hypothetical protein PPERSA_08827 [Pseudocohnilembus persalinus]|eukprot:KRX09111.1 hypothetical protein PPERSA_08827 [Pseudocohnilembus persalinus]
MDNNNYNKIKNLKQGFNNNKITEQQTEENLDSQIVDQESNDYNNIIIENNVQEDLNNSICKENLSCQQNQSQYNEEEQEGQLSLTQDQDNLMKNNQDKQNNNFNGQDQNLIQVNLEKKQTENQSLIKSYQSQNNGQYIQQQNSQQKSEQGPVDNFLNQNPEYLEHLKGNCGCFDSALYCQFNKIRLKIDLRTVFKSVSHHEHNEKLFQSKEAKEDNQQLVKQIKKMNGITDRYKQQENEFLEHISTSRRDYTSQEGQKPYKIKKPEYKPNNIPLPKSTYDMNFYDYKISEKIEQIKASTQLTTIAALPFFKGTSEYKDELKQKQIKKYMPIGDNWKTSFISYKNPFLQESSTKASYKGYYQNQRPKINSFQDEIKSSDLECYKGQFKSRYQNDFIQIQNKFENKSIMPKLQKNRKFQQSSYQCIKPFLNQQINQKSEKSTRTSSFNYIKEY